MPYKFADRVKEATTTTGTGTITLLGASAGFQSFAQGIDVGDETTYCIQDTVAGTWEVGVGTLVTASTFSRDDVLKSSSGVATLVNFAAGTKDIFITSSGYAGIQVPERPSGTPTVGGMLQVFNKPLAGRAMVAQIGSAGLDTILQPHWGRNKIATWNPAGNSTTITANGATGFSATGTATTASVNTANRHRRQRRVDYRATTASTTAVSGWRYTQAMWTIGGSNDGDGGFTFVNRFSPSFGVANANHVCYVGMSSSTAAPSSVQPSSQNNIVGVGYDSADDNWQIMHSAGGATVKIDLGSQFPVPTTDTLESYELALFASPGNTSNVGWQFSDNVLDRTTSGVITTSLPAISTLLTMRGWVAAGGTSSVTGIALMSCYIESDY